jgi:sterol desaturase/sphingolipid hydroxylase (fatty acid hydroxylase superfamily)
MTEVMLKSKTGLPKPGFPQGVELREEARKARHRLYPVSAVYTAYSLAVVVAALASHASWRTVLTFYLLGGVSWTWVEYMAHRHVLHGAFPDGGGLRRLLHRAFDHLHWEHHARPWDGNHINGTLKDTLPVVLVLGSLSFLAPLPTLPVLVAGLIQFYILEEWVHHSVHFCHFDSRYFIYIRKHHLFHHSMRGSEVAYGLTSGLWDAVLETRIPGADRKALYSEADSSR